jgi:hypothetical protein
VDPEINLVSSYHTIFSLSLSLREIEQERFEKIKVK